MGRIPSGKISCGTSGDIAFAKWAREVDKNAAPQLQSYQNALKTYESNTGAANDAIQQQELQLAQLKAMAGDPGSASASTSQNPLLLALQQQEAEANSASSWATSSTKTPLPPVSRQLISARWH